MVALEIAGATVKYASAGEAIEGRDGCDYLFCVFEHSHGGDLGEFIKSPGSLSLDTVRLLLVTDNLTLCGESELVNVLVPLHLFDVCSRGFSDLRINNIFEFSFG